VQLILEVTRVGNSGGFPPKNVLIYCSKYWRYDVYKHFYVYSCERRLAILFFNWEDFAMEDPTGLIISKCVLRTLYPKDGHSVSGRSLGIAYPLPERLVRHKCHILV
jgi:hypothetical protein